MSGAPARVVISGMVAGDPHQGGATWAVLQYVLGLAELGHEVLLVEPVAATVTDDSEVAMYFHDLVARFDLAERAALLRRGTRETIGLPYAAVRERARAADVLLDVAGMLDVAELTETIPVRVYLDLDPAFVQLWEASEGVDMRFDGHTHFATVGLEVGRPGCGVPTCGRQWIPTVPPVALRHWPVATTLATDAFTTVGHWRSYGSITHDNHHYGQKAHSLRALLDLPRRTRERLRLALAIHPDEAPDLDALRTHGWELEDPRAVAATPDRYRTFVSGSKGELGIAKSGYVASRCGWFSDRSVCYLAAGRPVLAQDTGWSAHLPAGEGLLTFATVDDAVAGLDAVRGNPARHARAARDIAVEHFDGAKVLPRLLAAVGVG